jgi:hypothetical protein
VSHSHGLRQYVGFYYYDSCTEPHLSEPQEPRWRKILENRTLETISGLLMDKDHRAVSETLEALGELLQYGITV